MRAPTPNACLVVALAAAACSTENLSPIEGASASASSSTGDSGTEPEPFQPEGCAFSIAGRPEYVDFGAASSEVGASPDIRRVRLGLGGNVAVGAAGRADPATTAGFAWQTNEGTLASEVAWGNSPDPESWAPADRTSGVTWRTPEGLINGKGDERMHEAYVCGLSPATTYYYRVGGGPPGGEVWSDVYAFTTTPKAGAANVTVAVSGDARGQANDAWKLLQRRFTKKGVTLQLFSGDMIDLAPDQDEWERWLDAAWKDGSTLSTLGQLLMLAAHGNHENHTSLFFGNLVLPQDPKAYPDYGELFFSTDVGPVHIVVIDDFFVVSPDVDPKYAGVLGEWLEADLGAAVARRSEVPWIIAVHHHGPYSSSNHGGDSDVLLGRAFFTPIWDKFHVDLDVAGHDHDYERSKPLKGPADRPVVQPTFADGTVYVVSGGAGADPYSAGTSPFTEISRDFKTGGAIGFYTFLTVNETSLAIESRELRADETDPVIDSVTITK